MSRSSHQRQQQQLLAQQQQQMADNDAAAAAAEMFDMFCLATTMRQVLGLHRNICDTIGLRPAPLNEFYPKLKAKIRSWKAQALWKKFDARAAHRAYSKGNACTGTRVLVIGAGPCGLRTAIEAQLLGAKVVVVEKRDRISRNNVLHLWPFVITDLRNLGAKKFYGKFCAGSIDHISIRQIQCILLKVALLLGVEVHEGVSFEGTIEPSEGCGWRAAVVPDDHAVSHYEFDVLIGADGKRNTLEAFKRKEFRGKLAIAITANFINKKTEAEAKAEEISGVAFIFNQAFFKELYHTTGIDLENIVYYKDETHYFVMTAKKHSLIDKGVILQDFADPAELLAPQNVNTDKLLDYAREAAEFSTKYQMPNLEFAVNHYGKPDVAMFDFTSMFAAESSSRVIVRKNYRLLQCLVGDSLLEPFWPTGSGCARGFLSSMDAAYAIKLWNNPRNSILGVLAQRESIYRLLAQTTPENLQRDIGSYTVDPATRYPNLNRTSVNVYQVKHLIDTDDKLVLEQTYMDTNALQASQAETPVRRKRRTGDTLPLSAVLLRWIKAQLHSYEFVQNLNEVSDCFTNGKVLCALINRYRPDLVDLNSVKDLPAAESNDLAFKILDKELKISRVMNGKDSIELDKIDSKIWLNYLEQICEVFRGEIPHVKHPKLDVAELREKNRNNVPDFSKLLQMSSRKAKSPMQDVADLPHTVQRRSVLDEEKVKRQRKHEPGQAQLDTPRRAKKRRSAEKTTNIEERQQRLKEIEENRQDRQSKRRMQRFQQTQNFYKSLHMLQVNTLLRESDESSPFEDYSIYMYRQQAPIFNDRVKELERKLLYPDRERGILSALPRGTDEQFSDRIKSMEQRISSRNAYGTEKKPKDLMRAIGKIDSNDWNVREIEKKIEQSKKTETGVKGREKVPKWSKEQFVARQSKMSKPTRQDSGEEKFKEIDQTLKNLDKQLKEGSVLEVGERGKNKVASIAGQFVKKDDTSEEKNPPTQPIAKSNSKVALAFKKQAASEKCHFCKQTVYLMEKISTEGLIFHRSCLKCHHCHTNLRPGGYAFDRDDPDGRFYCTQHFRLPAKAIRPVVRKPGQRKTTAHGSHAPGGLEPKTPEKPRGITESVVQLDLLDRGQTPERIEFENTDAMSDGEPSEEHIIDENEWSGRNFLQPSADSESDLSSSSDESDDDSESDIFEEANGSPIAQQTLQLATDWIGKQHYSNVNSDDSDDDFYDSSEGLADDGKDDTEGEEIKKAREMRREEVRLLPLPTNLPTDTETENLKQVVEAPQDSGVLQNIDEEINSERLERELDISTKASQVPPTKADIEKIEQNSDRRLSAEVDAISEKLYRLNNLMKLSKDIESMAKDNLVKSDILKKLSLKEKWLLDNTVSGTSQSLGFPGEKVSEAVGGTGQTLGFPGEEVNEKVDEEQEETKVLEQSDVPTEPKADTSIIDKAPVSGVNGDDDRGDGLQLSSSHSPNLISEEKPAVPVNEETSLDDEKENIAKIASEKMEIEGILDFVKMMDNTYIEQSKEPLPKTEPSPKTQKKDVGKMLYDAEQKKVHSLSDALHQIEVKSFAGTMDTIKAQMVMPTISQQATLDISKYFPNAKQEKQSSASLNKTQKTLKDVDLAKYFPQSPVAQRKSSISISNDKLKKSQTAQIAVAEVPKAPPRRQKSIAAPPSSEKKFSMHEHQLDGAIDIQKAPVVKPVSKKGGIKIVKKIVPKGTKAKKSAPVIAQKIQDESDKILDEILQSGQEVRSPSLEYQKLFTEEKSPSEDISERIEKILEETGIDLGLPPKPKKKLLKTKSLGEEEFKRTQEKILSKEDGDRPTGVQKILQRFESMSSIKSDESCRLRKTNFSSTCSSLNKSKESLHQSSGSLKSNSDSLSDLDKTMEYLKSEWRTEATNFLQKKRDSFYASRDEKQAKQEAEAKKPIQPESQWKHTKYSKFFGIKEKSPEKRKSPSKSGLGSKRKSPAKILKKSPREEIVKHRKKIETVSSRTASFEEKIKAVNAKPSSSQTGLSNGLGSKDNSRNTSFDVADLEVNQSPSKIPVSQTLKDSQKPPELSKNILDTAQKVLSRRGSSSSGLADVLKPPVVKGIRGQLGEKSKIESNKVDSSSATRKVDRGEDALKNVLKLARQISQSNLNDMSEHVDPEEKKNLSSESPRGSQNNIESPVGKSRLQADDVTELQSIKSKDKVTSVSSVLSTQSESTNHESKVQEVSALIKNELEKSALRTPADAQDILPTVSISSSKIESQSEELPLEPQEKHSNNQESVVDTKPKEFESKEPIRNEPLPEIEQTETTNDDSKYQEESVSIGDKLEKSPIQSSAVTEDVLPTTSLSTSEIDSQNEAFSLNLAEKPPSRKGSQNDTKTSKIESPLHQSRKGSLTRPEEKSSQAEVKQEEAESPSVKSRRQSKAETPPKHQSRRESATEEHLQHEPSQKLSTSCRRTSKVLDSPSKTEEISDEVDEIFNKIINELGKDEDELFRTAQEVSLIAMAAEEDEQIEPQPMNDETDQMDNLSESPKLSRASSEDSIEKLFSQFSNDMLVDVEFDSNDEVIGITPRAVLVNEPEEDDSNEKLMTVEDAKLKFEPLFPRQKKIKAKSSSSSMSVSPSKTESKAKKIVQKLDPSDMAPSVQDMLQIIIPREDSEPNERLPRAFPRRIYGSEEDLFKSRPQTPLVPEKLEENEAFAEEVDEVRNLIKNRIPSPPLEEAIQINGNPERHFSRRGSKNLEEPVQSTIEEQQISRESPKIQPGSPKLLPSSRRTSLSSPDKETTTEEFEKLRSTSRKGSKASIRDNDEVPLVGSPASLPTPRRNSRVSVDTDLLQKNNESTTESASYRGKSTSSTTSPIRSSIEKDTVENNEISTEASNYTDTRKVLRESPVLLPTPRRKSSDPVSPPASQRETAELSPLRRGSPSVSEVLEPFNSDRKTTQGTAEVEAPQRKSAEISPSRRGSVSITEDAEALNSNRKTSRDSVEVELHQRETVKTSPSRKTSAEMNSNRKTSQDSVEEPLSVAQAESQKMSVLLREAEKDSTTENMPDIQRKTESTPKYSKSPSPAPKTEKTSVSDSSRESSKAPRQSPPNVIIPRRCSGNQKSLALSRRGSKTSTTSPPRAEGMVNIVDLLNQPEPKREESSSIARNHPAPVPESPQTARARFFAQNSSREGSARESKERVIQNNDTSREYRDLLRSKLESPTPRPPSRSRERSLEWDMEQLPRSPMPRRKYLNMYRNESDKEDSPKHSHSLQPTPPPGKTAPDIRIPTKRLEEWEIIEQLEQERRLALIKRDENYSHQVQEASSANTEESKNIHKHEIPRTLNRLESSDEPHSSKLMEYIKQETLKDSTRQKDDSPKPPSRPRTPQLSKKPVSTDLERQVEELLKSQESPKPVQKRQPPLQKTESVEATYEDFARFTRRSVGDDAESEDIYASPTPSVSHNRLSNYRQKSQESASGTYSPTSSLSRSVDNLAPTRPHRNKSSTLPENKIDKDTKYLMNRSKHLRNMKRDFMEEKIAGNNPYLKKVMEAQKNSRDSEEEDVEVDYALESYRPKNHTTPRFPTSSTIVGRRRVEPRYPDYSSTSSNYSRRPYTPHYSAGSTSSSIGSRNFVDYFKRSPPHYKVLPRLRSLASDAHDWVRSPKVQSDSESSSADDVELNSATEISTDSEFDHDEIIREAPKIFIDDTHLRKPTKVQIKQTVIAPSTNQPKYHINHRMSHQQQQPAKREPQFKPLVQVDPSLLSSNRMPLQNPRPGDYLLNKTASTEGIASKKSLELKKRYLLGEQGNGNKIQKSGSTSILDSKIRSFHSNISECQKLLNAGSMMKPFLDRTKSGEIQAAGDKKVEITIKKTAIDEKENVFVNSKNELNKGMEYSETVNTTLVESLNKNKSSPIIETIDLISPEKTVPIIDLTQVEIPTKMLETNMEFIKNLQFGSEDGSSKENSLVPDNKIIDLTLDSPVKSDKTVIEELIEKPDVSKDAKEAIPDIITHIEDVKLEKQPLLDHEVEKKDSPEKTEYDIQETSIRVPNIPWAVKKCITESDSLSSSSSSSVEDIQHFILDSTTSPDTQTGQIVPRLEVHDSSGTLMQIDSLMIIDGKYIGDPEDLKDMEIPPGMIIPEVPTQSPSPEEPVTEKRKDDSPSSQRPELRFDTKNENKIDTLKNIPLILEKAEDHNRVVKPDSLNIKAQEKKADSDNDKTPTADALNRGSDSDAEITNQVLTETELSDWTADDAISENFIDLEFVLNSNKGTIKRNKKSKKKAPLQSALSITQEPEREPEPCGILKNLDIEEIEFMDTGSEGSCAEAYSATNTALLRNRGYVQYSGSPRNYSHNRAPTEHELKTPVNECPTLPSTALLSQKPQSQQAISTPPKQSSPSQTQNTTQSFSQSLTDSTNDIDEDSLCILTNSHGATANNTATITTTTEESEALTVVTSPMDSSSPKTQENFQLTGSSSEHNGKTTSPSSNTTATPVTSSSSKGPTRKSSHEDLLTHGNSKRKESEEMSYEEYVRKLQQKITQISNARDSIDVRKQNRRKSSKGEGSEANSVIEGNTKGLSVFEGGFSAAVQPKVVLSNINVAVNLSQDVHKVPEIPTLSSKLEELTKERTKQKDLIHDLVMDKLQCKKQLNAEKRLNRSRNRSMFGNNLTGSSLSPTPKMTSANTSPYHVTSSSGGDHSGSSCKENNPLVGHKTKISPKEMKDVVQMFAEGPPRSAKQRPFSENFDNDSIDDQMCKLSKTQSFTYSSKGGNFPLKNESNGTRQHVLSTVYASPLAPSRSSRKDEPTGSVANADKLRTEARARARLKSNHDLGLSPEEKLQLLRKRYHLDLQEATAEAAQQKSEEMRARDRKMVSSKSVNDITTAQLMTLQPDENSNTTTVRSDLVADFTSDPNLSQMNMMAPIKLNRRQKDPERRKSIIQTFSSFFQKGNKKEKDVGPVSGTEKSGTSQGSAATGNNAGGGGDGMFSRFRISPKSKEKSKDNGSSPTTPVATTPQHQYRHHNDQRSNSQDCIAKQKYQKMSSYASSPQLFKNTDEQIPPPIPPLPLNYQRSDDESYATESREQKKQRAITKATRQAELKRLRIAQEIQREQEEIEVQLKELEARGVLIEKALRGEGQTIDNLEASNMGANDEKLLKELLEIWRNITQLKKRDEELGIRQQELQLEHRHAQLKDELNIRLSGSKLEKSSADVAAEGAILNEMLEIVAKRAALRPTSAVSSPVTAGAIGTIGNDKVNDSITFSGRQSSQIDESDI